MSVTSVSKSVRPCASTKATSRASCAWRPRTAFSFTIRRQRPPSPSVREARRAMFRNPEAAIRLQTDRSPIRLQFEGAWPPTRIRRPPARRARLGLGAGVGVSVPACNQLDGDGQLGRAAPRSGTMTFPSKCARTVITKDVTSRARNPQGVCAGFSLCAPPTEAYNPLSAARAPIHRVASKAEHQYA